MRRRAERSERGRDRGRRGVWKRALAALLALLWAGSATADGERVVVDPVTEIVIDDDGRGLHYPSAIFFDPVEEELYLVNGGSSRVIVYGPDFFPRNSMGSGRGIAAPRGVYVADDGRVYICQGRSTNNPHPRITILNAAFFMEKEILLDGIPEAADFSPRQVAVSRDGLLYVAGESSRGVLVLDREGTFLRRLQPMDLIADREAIAAAARQPGEGSAPPDGTEARGAEPAPSRGDIPEEFRPRSGRGEGSASSGPDLGPVRIRHVAIDSAGNLYLMSAETSRIYVYDADEKFLFAFGEKGGTPRKLSQPRGLAIDEERRLIYVADYMRHTILVYDLAGRFLFEFGGRGGGPGWFNFPADIAVNRQGQVIVADLFNRRVQVLELDYTGAFPLFREVRQAPEEEAPPAESAPDGDLPASPDAEGGGQSVPGETAQETED